MRTALSTTLVAVMLVFGLIPVLAEDRDGHPDDQGATPESTAPSSTVVPDGIDGPPLVVNGEAISPDLICAGVDGAVAFIDGGTRYIAGFEDGPFLRVILGDEVLETHDVTLEDNPSGAYTKGIVHGEFDELAITMYLDDGLDDCPELSGEPTEATDPQTTVPEPSPAETVTTTTEASDEAGEESEPGIDGHPLVVNDQALTPELICAGVEGAVIFVDEDDGIRYIAGFEDGPFLRVILSDGDVLETKDVNLTNDPSGTYAKGILEGGFEEANITMYLDDGLDACPELG